MLHLMEFSPNFTYLSQSGTAKGNMYGKNKFHFILLRTIYLVGPWPLFQLLDLFTQSLGLLGRGISPSQDHYLHRATQTQSQRRHTPMP
jgi:hypothetical protein